MARKRGGLAGIYDRNKKVIKTLAPIAAGFIPGVGPAIGAALGAAMGGDREGKGYFKGFNTKGAALGGLSGYGGAKLGQAAKGGLSKMFTGGVSPVDKLTGAPTVGLTPRVATNVVPNAVPNAVTNAASNVASGGVSSSYKSGYGLGQSVGNATSKGYGFIKDNEKVLGKIAGGIQAIRNDDLDDELERFKIAETGRQFDKTYGINAAQEADRKRREEDLMAQRAAFRAMFTGMA